MIHSKENGTNMQTKTKVDTLTRSAQLIIDPNKPRVKGINIIPEVTYLTHINLGGVDLE